MKYTSIFLAWLAWTIGVYVVFAIHNPSNKPHEWEDVNQMFHGILQFVGLLMTIAMSLEQDQKEQK